MTSHVQINPPASSRWLSGWMNYVAKWMGNGEENDIPTQIDEFEEGDIKPEDWAEWEWILSPSEEFLQKHNQWQMEKTESELNILRGTSAQVCIIIVIIITQSFAKFIYRFIYTFFHSRVLSMKMQNLTLHS